MKFNEITHEWLNEQMIDLKIDRATVMQELGINAPDLSNYLSGRNPLSKVRKSQFYYYFKWKSVEKIVGEN